MQGQIFNQKKLINNYYIYCLKNLQVFFPLPAPQAPTYVKILISIVKKNENDEKFYFSRSTILVIF